MIPEDVQGLDGRKHVAGPSAILEAMRVEAQTSRVRHIGWTLAATGASLVLLVWAATSGLDESGAFSATTYVIGASLLGLLSFVALVRGLRPRRRALATIRQSEVTEFAVLPPWAHRMRWVAVVLTTSPWIVLNVLRFLPAFSVAVIAVLYAMLGLPLLLPQRLLVGEDGVLLRWAGRTRFVPFARIVAVRETPLGIELDLGWEEPPLEIRVGHRADTQAQKRAQIVARIDAGMAAQRALAHADDEGMLARGERPLEAWIDAAEALGQGDAGYRVAAIPRDRLWAVLENAAADPSAREAAAIALRVQLADEERERLDLVAQRSASPRLRITLDAVTTGVDAAGLRAVLEDEPEPALRGRS